MLIFINGSIYGFVFNVLGNGLCNQGSNAERICLSHCANTLGKGKNPTILSPTMGE